MNDVIIQDINFELLQAIEFYYCIILSIKLDFYKRLGVLINE